MDLMTRRRAIMGMPSGKDYTVSGNVVSISNALAKNAKSLIVSFSPKQSGSGDPSPNNVRPITGYNDIGAVRYGKNYLSDLTRNSSGYSVTVKFTKDSVTLTGTASSSGGRNVFRSEYFSLSAGTYRFVRTNESDVKPSVYLQNGTSIISASSDGVFTLSADSTQMNIGLNVTSGTTYDYHCSFVILASTDISPVTANVHSDTTLFGGTVDLVSGELKVTGILETFITDDGNAIMSQLNSFSKQSTGVGTIGSYTRISFAVRGDVDQTQFNRLSNTYATPFCNYAKHYFAYNNESIHWYRNTVLYLFLPTSLVGSTGQSVYDWLKSIASTEPLSMWVDLANPITYQLTPSQLALLKGNNTVYSNEGSISLTYVGK